MYNVLLGKMTKYSVKKIKELALTQRMICNIKHRGYKFSSME